MSFFRGLGLVIVSVLLFVALILAGIFGTLSMSLKYENVQPTIYAVADEVISTNIGGKEMVNQLTPFLTVYCINNTEIVQNFGNYTMVFPCSVVSEGYASILNYSVDYLVKDFYYKDYNCSFMKCFEQSNVPIFLISDFARNYWKSLLFKASMIIIVLCLLAFFLAKKKSNSFYLTGTLFVITSFIILQLEKIGPFISKLIISPISSAIAVDNSEDLITQIIGIFFSEASTMFVWMFVIGLLLIALGIFFSLTSLGFKVKQKIEDMTTRNKVEELEKKEKMLEDKLNQVTNKNKNFQKNQQKQKKE